MSNNDTNNIKNTHINNIWSSDDDNSSDYILHLEPYLYWCKDTKHKTVAKKAYVVQLRSSQLLSFSKFLDFLSFMLDRFSNFNLIFRAQELQVSLFSSKNSCKFFEKQLTGL